MAEESIKHPLRSPWSFWMFTNDNTTWEKNLVELTSFDTVEDYWCLYHHMKTPSELRLGQDYSVFKKGIRPMWEDRANRCGGRWIINLDKKYGTDLDRLWLCTVLLLIGENFEQADEICGVVVNVRAKSKIAVWIKNAENEKANLLIGYYLKQQLGQYTKLGFHAHNSVNNMYTL